MGDGGREIYGGRMGSADGGTPVEVADTEAAQGNSEEGGGDSLGRKEEGCVYFIETEGGEFIKIGYSNNPYRRLNQFGTLRPGNFALRLIGWMPGTLGTERWLHGKFREDARIN